MCCEVVGDALERRAHGFLRQRQPEEDGPAGAVTGLADGSGIDDDGIPAAGFERFVERDGSERAHTVEEARTQGWEELANGALIEAAEQAGFDLMVTTDKNIRYQQNLEGRRLALVVLKHSQWPMVKLVTASIVAAVNAATPGSYVEVDVPFKK